ncbi:MAG: helix-turn-helix transcriptional regulator [Clostridiales bacterium]|nr:helix-turn-helix transcriptional regulator [Clostridiales bacterium]MBQ1572509.1 helix-turn-helix transcriptional regulator [Clostridiales bacterium]
MIISETIKARRTMLRMTQQQLADISGVSRSTIHKYELGLQDPTYNIQAVLGAMGLELCVRRKQK